ncbi:MAG: sulfotransferase family 2 domain-containing protein [Vulcanimicrobiota bacterium]
MIVSFRHQFIFLAVPRTASHAIRQSLRPHLAATDWEQSLLFGPRCAPVQALAALRHGHVSATQLRPFLPPWDEYLKFAVVRNPYSRFLSAAAFLYRDTPLPEDPRSVLKRLVSSQDKWARLLLRPMVDTLLIEDELAVDVVCRFEHLEQDLAGLFGRLQLPFDGLPRANASAGLGFEAYDAELEQMVGEFYARDFSRFGYSRSLSGGEDSFCWLQRVD